MRINRLVYGERPIGVALRPHLLDEKQFRALARAAQHVANAKAIYRSVPWTRRVADRKTTRNGRRINLLEFIRSNRSLFVLKPNDDYGGHGVYFRLAGG
jgi:hypothetical protein